MTLTQRCALDSMTAVRRAVLDVLEDGEAGMTTADVARVSGLHRHVTRFRLEELEVVGVVHGERYGADGDDEADRRRCTWRLSGTDGRLVQDVLNAAAGDEPITRRRWREK